MKERISFRERFGYGLGDLASNLFWMQFVWFLNYFYTDVFGLAPAVLGSLIFWVRIWDSVNDPLVGLLADRTETRWGKFRPYLLWGALPFAVVGTLTFTTPNLSPHGKLVYAYVTYGLMVLIYTVVNIPYSALMGVVSPDPSERVKFSQMRFIMAFTGGLIVQATTLPLVSEFGSRAPGVIAAEIRAGEVVVRERGEGSSKLEVAALAPDYQPPTFLQRLALQFGLLEDRDLGREVRRKTFQVHSADYYREAGIDYEKPPKSFEDISYLVKGFGEKHYALSGIFPGLDLSARRLTLRVVNEQKGFQRAIAVFAGLAAFLFLITFATTKERVRPPKGQHSTLLQDLKDLVRNGPWWILFIAGIITLFHVCMRNGSILYWCKYNLGNERLGSLFMVAGTLANLVSIFLVGLIERVFGKKYGFAFCIASSGLLSASFYFIPEEQVGLLLTVHVLKNLAFGPTAALIWAMYTDVADYGEWKNGRRSTGLVMSASTMAQKLGYTLGGMLTMQILAYIGYQANAVQTARSLAGIKSMVSWIAAIPCVIGLVLILFYPLNKQKLEQIRSELEARRSAA